MIDILLKTSFFSSVIFLIIGLYFHYRVQHLMFFKVRPFLKQHGKKSLSGILVLGRKKDLLLFEEICLKNKMKSELPVSIKIFEKRSWIFIIISVLFIIVCLTLMQFSR